MEHFLVDQIHHHGYVAVPSPVVHRLLFRRSPGAAHPVGIPVDQ